MKNLPEDDERLVDFLRKHRPDIPPAAPDLEETIFRAVESSASNPNPLSKSNPTSWFRQLWLVPPAIAATVVLALNSDTLRSNTLPKLAHFEATNSLSQIESLKLKAWNSPNPKHRLNDEELLYLEAYLENNWNGVVANSHPEMEVEAIEAEYMSLANSTSPYSVKSAKLSTTRR